MQCNIASKHTIALNVNSTLKWNVKARYEAFNISFFPGYSQTNKKQQHQQSVANVFDWSCAIFWYIFFWMGNPLEKFLLKYSNILYTTAKSINFQRHYILSAVHHSDMRQTKVNMQSRRATPTTATTKTLGIISIWSFVAVTLSSVIRCETLLHGYNEILKNVFDFMHG